MSAEGVYDIACPRCGAAPTEACWNLRIVDSPNQWPHRERIDAVHFSTNRRETP